MHRTGKLRGRGNRERDREGSETTMTLTKHHCKYSMKSKLPILLLLYTHTRTHTHTYKMITMTTTTTILHYCTHHHDNTKMLLAQLIRFTLVTRLSLVLRMLVEQFDMQLYNKHALTARSSTAKYSPLCNAGGRQWRVRAFFRV